MTYFVVMRSSSQRIMSDEDSDASTDLLDVFTNNPSKNSFDSESEPDNSDNSDRGSDDDSILDEEGGRELPAEYYLQEADCLDVSLLRHKRYSLRTQDKLDETRDYWDQ